MDGRAAESVAGQGAATEEDARYRLFAQGSNVCSSACSVKLTQERDDLSKQLAKSVGKEQQFKNELKKRDQTIAQLQESMKKLQSDKGVVYKNSFEVVQELEQTGPFLYYVNAEHEFGQLVQKNYE